MSIKVPPPVPGHNAAVLWQQALAQAEKTGDSEICFQPGRYEFFPENCSRRYCWFSNNDEGIKTIALALRDRKDFRISGERTEFCFHGRISPLAAENCTRLSIRGITIDFEDSFVSDADVVRRDGKLCWLKIGGKHRFENGRLHFSEDFCDNLSGQLVISSFDPEKQELVWNDRGVQIPNRGLLERDGLIGIPDLSDRILSDALVIRHEARLCPGLVFDRCQDVQLEDITIHHAAGMGVLAQLCRNVSLKNVRVIPRGRRASVSDDAVHFSECRGKLSLEDCILTGTLDDSFNAHGIYRPLKMRIPGGRFYYLDSGHFQQQGLPGAFPGDTLELVKNDTGKPYARIKLKEARLLNKSITQVIPEEELPPEWKPGDCARVLESASAELLIRRCTFRPLCGRGALVSGVKKAVISGCAFHTSGAAVFVAGDTGFWYEAGPVGEMVLENNFFDNCCYRKYSSTREQVAVFPELEKLEDGFFYHGEIRLMNNRFRSARRPQILMLSVSRAVLQNNSFEEDRTYPFDPPAETTYSFAEKDSPWAVFRHCKAVIRENNTFF